MNSTIKVTKILEYNTLLLDLFRFSETYFTTYQRFVAEQSAISPFLGGLEMSEVQGWRASAAAGVRGWV